MTDTTTHSTTDTTAANTIRSEAAPSTPQADLDADQAHAEEEAESASVRAAVVGSPPDDDTPSGEADEEPRPGRPKKPMLAAAALVGTVLLAVPLLIATQGGEEKKTDQATAASEDIQLAQSDGELGSSGRFVEQPSGQKPEPGGAPKVPLPPDAGAPPGKGGVPNLLNIPKTDDTPDGQDESKKPEPLSGPAGPTERKPYWESQARTVKNEHTGKCLAKQADTRIGTQGSCDNATWLRYVVGDGTFLLKNPADKRCLDTDGTKMYVSSCTTADPGQVWRMPMTTGECNVAVLTSKHFGKNLTGWDAGNITLAPAAGTAPEKQQWLLPGLTKC
ncbi:RICIN domain-containing protein [Streptomyces sp. NPDC098781]|uniref:RICIN domain-containing protein n=1 Tax=Streptomyces sp. NPDC098781 TaxID=3366097 RepID=UPI00381E9DEE